jgi:2-polyprenyl-3-methyl-5-hydroxy-6-metoxy-1,4-benzoquinol methylase
MQYAYGENLRPELIPFIPAVYSKVLEIGSSYGTFRQNLVAAHEYWGVELDPEIGAISKRYLDKVLVGNYFDVEHDLPDDYFDLVICNDVIEHLEHPSLFLTRVRKKMKLNASLIGSIPNVRHLTVLRMLLIDKKWEYQSAGILDKTHLRFFCQTDIVKLFEENHFDIEQCIGVNGYVRQFNFRYLIKYMIFLVLGRDLSYIQFAFRVCKRTP